MNICPLCELPSAALEGHHIWPRCYGGPDDGPMIDICSNCHRGVHKTAEGFTSGKKRIHFANGPTYERAKPYIHMIMRAKFSAKENQSEDQKRRIILHVDEITLVRIHKRKKDLGFSSLDAYLTALIKYDLGQK